MKKTTSLFLCLAMILSMFTLIGTAASAESESEFLYSFDDKTLTAEITSYSGVDTVLEIPSKLGKYTVTGIGEMAFEYNYYLETVTIPNTVKSIGNDAFSYCENLKSITIPYGVKTIGQGAFEECKKLKKIVIPDSVTELGSYAFYQCNSLESVTLSANLKTIDIYTFYYCKKLESITVPDSVTTINACAFRYCEALKNITLGKNIDNISYDVFDGTEYLNTKSNWEDTTLYIGNYLISGKYSWYDYDEETYIYQNSKGDISVKDGTKVIAGSAFHYSDITSISLPDSVISICKNAFAGCKKLNSINLNKVKTIDNDAFYACESLESITVPDSVTEIGDDVFYNCTKLKNIKLGKNIEEIGSDIFYNNGFYNTKSNWSGTALYCGEYLLTASHIYDYNGNEKREQPGTNFTVKNGTKVIATDTFAYCYRLENVTVPSSVKTISEYAFYACPSLKSVKLAEGLKTICEGAFYNCYCLDGLTVPKSVTKIADEAFGFYYDSLLDITTKNNNAVLTGYNGSAAEKYAKANAFKFVLVKANNKPLVLSVPNFKLTAGKKLFKVKYTAVPNAVGFQIRYKIKGKWTVKTFNSAKSVTKTIKKLKSGKNYKVQIRAFSQNQKVYSNWSKAKTVKVK